MCYKNGKDVIPAELLKKLQEYIEGELVYIPRKNEKRLGWGENNGTRKAIEQRNREIFERYSAGLNCSELSERYYLSEDSIRKIIAKQKAKDNNIVSLQQVNHGI